MNKSILSNIFVFAAGAAVGSIVTLKLVSKKYEQIAQEEIEAIREVYYREEDERSEELEESDDEDEPDDDYFYDEEDEEENEEEEFIVPYVISPEDFDEIDYETVTLYYFADGVLTTMNNEVIEPDEIDNLIGEHSLTTFGQYEDDSVFVRNDNLKTDFEILKDNGRFSEVE